MFLRLVGSKVVLKVLPLKKNYKRKMLTLNIVILGINQWCLENGW